MSNVKGYSLKYNIYVHFHFWVFVSAQAQMICYHDIC